MNVIHTNVELILEHPCTFITHTGQRLSPLVISLRIHKPEYPLRTDKPTDQPTAQKLPPPSFPDLLGNKVVVVEMIPPILEREFHEQIIPEPELDYIGEGIIVNLLPLHFFSIYEQITHGNFQKKKNNQTFTLITPQLNNTSSNQ